MVESGIFDRNLMGTCPGDPRIHKSHPADKHWKYALKDIISNN